MKEYTYIDLEDAIYKVWQTSDDLDMFYHYHGDHPKPMTEDEVANALLGLKLLHDMRCERLMDMMCKVHKLDQYTTDPEVLEARQRVYDAHDLIGTPKKKGKKK